MRFLAEFKESQLLEDARYRLALAQYGSHNVDAALQTLRECVADDRSTTLAMDARSMLGDVYASRDQLDEAVSVFRQIVDGAESASQVNYATFQLIKLYEKRQQYQPIIALCREYLARYPTSDKVTEAMFWMVKAEIALGHYQAARDVFSEALVRYGNLPEHLGIDLMLQAVAGAGVDESLFGEQTSEVLLQLEHHLDHSRQHNQRTFELRMVAFFVDSDADPVRRQVWVAQLLNQQDLAVASALTLHVMGRECLSQDQTGRAQEVYEYLLAHYGSSEWGTLAVVALAEMHTASGDYDAALALLEDGRSQLVQKSVPGRVAKIRADVLRLQGSHDEAVEAYLSILGNHEWRGELWPASLFGIGESFRERGELENAFAYYQRVYVLYEGYPRWAARAYLQSAVCLEKLLRHDEAIATYREMLSKEFLTEFKESKQARDALNRLGGKT